MVKRIVIIMSILVMLLLTNSTYAGLLEVIVETDYHHLGDDTINWMHNPSPEGVIWEKTFILPPFSASVATIAFTAAHIQHTDITINGISIAIPIVEPNKVADDDHFYRTYVITIPAAAFHPGENKIGFKPLQQTNGNYDDIEFGKVILYLQ